MEHQTSRQIVCFRIQRVFVHYTCTCQVLDHSELLAVSLKQAVTGLSFLRVEIYECSVRVI